MGRGKSPSLHKVTPQKGVRRYGAIRTGTWETTPRFLGVGKDRESDGGKR